MITHEKTIFDSVAQALREEYPGIFVTGDYVNDTPPSFPSVAIIETNNTVNHKYSTFDEIENISISEIYIQIYSNLTSGRAAQCKSIAEVIDGVLKKYRYRRTLNQPIPNIDTSIARRDMRYVKENVTWELR